MSEGAKWRRAAVGVLVLAACGGRSIHTLERSATEVNAPSGGNNSGQGGNPSAQGGGSGVAASSGAAGGKAPVSVPIPGVGGTSTSPSSAASGGTGNANTADDPTTCAPDGIRLAIGGNTGMRPVPPGACLLDIWYYCAGESYTIDSGPCRGECTCVGDTTWNCSYDDAPSGRCEVDHCVRDGSVLEIGFGYTAADDDCTACTCTRQGMVCSDEECEVPIRCSELEDKYERAVPAAQACDPAKGAAECVARAASAPDCDGEIPVSDGSVLEQIKQRFLADGCLEISTPCPAYIALGTHTVCTAEGRCADVP